MLKPPNGYAEICETFGDPSKYLLADGTISSQWERHRLIAVALPEPLTLAWDPTPTDPAPKVSAIRCHYLLANELRAALFQVHGAGLWEGLNTYGGCYAFLRQRGGRKLSTHSWAIAIDVDVDRNPLGGTPRIDNRIVSIFEDRGWTWGGRWTRPDAQHFQFCGGY